MSAERDLAEAIRDEILARHALDAALTIWHDRPNWDERQRMWAVLAGISCCAIDTVLARRQSEAARTGPWDRHHDPRFTANPGPWGVRGRRRLPRLAGAAKAGQAMTEPGYWMHETSGVLRPAIEAYLHGDGMTAEQVAAMRAYLRQWIDAPHWDGADALEELRDGVDALTSRFAIADWLKRAEHLGINPL